jgi:hypothetical protein
LATESSENSLVGVTNKQEENSPLKGSSSLSRLRFLDPEDEFPEAEARRAALEVDLVSACFDGVAKANGVVSLTRE